MIPVLITLEEIEAVGHRYTGRWAAEVHFVEGTSNKFWRMESLDSKNVMISWGRIGNPQDQQVKPILEGMKKLREKLKKGYTYAPETELGVSKSPSPAKSTTRQVSAPKYSGRSVGKPVLGSGLSSILARHKRGSKAEHEWDEYDEYPLCEGEGTEMGQLGNRIHYRCRACGWDWSKTAPARAQEQDRGSRARYAVELRRLANGTAVAKGQVQARNQRAARQIALGHIDDGDWPWDVDVDTLELLDDEGEWTSRRVGR